MKTYLDKFSLFGYKFENIVLFKNTKFMYLCIYGIQNKVKL